MELLSKSQIQRAQQLDRAREIEEGKKLSHRVDQLRELVAQEEANLRKFRDETVRLIQTEITDLDAKRASLTGEVKALEDRRKAALEPLTHKEEKLRLKEQDLQYESERLYQANLSLMYEKQVLDEGKKELAQGFERLAEHRNTIYEISLETDEARVDAKQELMNAIKIRADAENFRDSVMLQLHEREMAVAARERDIENRAQSVERDAIINTTERKQLADMRATLERSLKRLKK